MPTKPKQHRPATPNHARPAQIRPTSTERGYDRHWTRLRQWYRRRHPFCADPFGLHQGTFADGEHVDHIVPLSQGGTNATSNLQTLCQPCHSRKTVRYDGGFGRQRIVEERRSDEKNGVTVPQLGTDR
jgi:5-methylcytosine-specific restriction protein A